MKISEIASLVKDIRKGDKEAFDELYGYLWDILYYSARKRLDNNEDANDVVQETMLEVIEKIHLLKNDMLFIPWVNCILSRKCYKINKLPYKHNYIDIEKIQEITYEERIEFLPEDFLENKEICREISRLVSELPVKQKEVILLYYFNEFSTKEIAEIMESNINAVKKNLSLARKTIKKKADKIQHKGSFMYSITTMPVLTRIFLQEMNEMCTPELKNEIYESIQLSLVSVGASATALAGAQAGNAVATSVGISAVSSGVIIKISASVLTIAIIGGMTFYVNLPTNIETIPVATTTTTTMADTTVLTQTQPAEVKPIETLEDVVGSEDADIIRSWVVPSEVNNNEAFMEMVEKHGLELDSIFVDIDNNQDTYALFTKEEQGKRLLMCEYYNAYTKMWSAVYFLEDISNPIPHSYYISTWFKDIQSKI